MASARDIVQRILNQYGLGSLTDLAMQEITDSDRIEPDRLLSSLRDTQEYKTRFAGLELRRQQGYNAISEAQYINLEDQYAQLMRAAGMPTGFYDSPDDFAQLIGANVSIAEVSQRVQTGYAAVRQSDPSVTRELQRLYGVTDGELAAFFLDPERALPIIEEQVATARIGAAAARQGFSETLNRQALERMAQLGISEQQATEGFGVAAQSQELLTQMDATEGTIALDEAVLGFTGQDAEAARRIRQRQQRRQAEFQGGGQFATQNERVVGLTTA